MIYFYNDGLRITIYENAEIRTIKWTYVLMSDLKHIENLKATYSSWWFLSVSCRPFCYVAFRFWHIVNDWVHLLEDDMRAMKRWIKIATHFYLPWINQRRT